MTPGLKTGIIIGIIVIAVVLVYFFFFKGSSTGSVDQAGILKAIAGRDAWYYPGTSNQWSDLAAWVKQDNGGQDGAGTTFWNNNTDKILAWFKGYNVAPTGWNYHELKQYINPYCASSISKKDSAVQVGQYKTAAPTI